VGGTLRGERRSKGEVDGEIQSLDLEEGAATAGPEVEEATSSDKAPTQEVAGRLLEEAHCAGCGGQLCPKSAHPYALPADFTALHTEMSPNLSAP